MLSETYPNPELEAKGYSIYYENKETANWEYSLENPDVYDAFNLPFSFGNQFGVYSYDRWKDTNNLYLADYESHWNEYRLPILLPTNNLKIIEFDGALYFFGNGEPSNTNACCTTDFQTWTAWNTDFGGSDTTHYHFDDIVVFKGALWAFVHTPDDSSYVVRSPDGIDWTTVAAASWDHQNLHAVADANKMWVSARDPQNTSNRVWSSSDGSTWKKSLKTTPSYGTPPPELVPFNNAIWCFVSSEDLTAEGECWKTYNDGDDWILVSTNVPAYHTTYNTNTYSVIEYEGKLWLCGAAKDPDDEGDDGAAVFWSMDGIEWHSSWRKNSGPNSLQLTGLPNGRLWLTTGDWDYYDDYAYIGGPKIDDGLYYYKKD